MLQTFKKILEGVKMEENVKFGSDQVIKHTSIILTRNNLYDQTAPSHENKILLNI